MSRRRRRLSEVERTAKGKRTENRFFSAVEKLSRVVLGDSWFYEIRPATPEEDRRGIDAVALIDVGEVPLQIKSSTQGREYHCLRHSGEGIPVVVILPSHPADTIRAQTQTILHDFREQFFRRARYT